MFQMELAQFEQAAKERRPDRAVLVRGKHWQDDGRELFAVVALKEIRLELLPQRDCLVAELYPLTFYNQRDGKIDDELSARLGYTRVNRFFLLVDQQRGKCRFGPPHGQIGLDSVWRSFGLGGYLMAQLIAWGRDRYPGAAVTTEHLDLSQVEVLRPLLNGFCKRAGFETIFHAQDSLTCFVKRLELLNPDYNHERVTEVEELAPEYWFVPGLLGDKAAEKVQSVLSTCH